MKNLFSSKRWPLFAVLTLTVSAAVFSISGAQAQSTIPLCEITRGLSTGATGEDVQCLQRYLNWAGFVVAAAGAGSPGNETIFFGPRTRGAVIRWQEAHAADILTPIGLTNGTGFWGPRSFAKYVSLVKVAPVPTTSFS